MLIRTLQSEAQPSRQSKHTSISQTWPSPSLSWALPAVLEPVSHPNTPNPARKSTQHAVASNLKSSYSPPHPSLKCTLQARHLRAHSSQTHSAHVYDSRPHQLTTHQLSTPLTSLPPQPTRLNNNMAPLNRPNLPLLRVLAPAIPLPANKNALPRPHPSRSLPPRKTPRTLLRIPRQNVPHSSNRTHVHNFRPRKERLLNLFSRQQSRAHQQRSRQYQPPTLERRRRPVRTSRIQDSPEHVRETA